METEPAGLIFCRSCRRFLGDLAAGRREGGKERQICFRAVFMYGDFGVFFLGREDFAVVLQGILVNAGIPIKCARQMFICGGLSRAGRMMVWKKMVIARQACIFAVPAVG